MTVHNPGGQSATLPSIWFVDFLDVPRDDPFHIALEELVRRGITAGCGSGNYCPSSPVSREQMAAMLLRADHGPAFVPPPCTGVFADVPCPSPFADWIEELAAQRTTVGCGNDDYCPSAPVSRGQMAVFLVRAFPPR